MPLTCVHIANAPQLRVLLLPGNTFLINMVVQAALLGYGSYLAKDPDIMLEPKILLAVMLYQGQLGEYFRNLLSSFNSLIKSSGAAAKVFDYIDRRRVIIDAAHCSACLPDSAEEDAEGGCTAPRPTTGVPRAGSNPPAPSVGVYLC